MQASSRPEYFLRIRVRILLSFCDEYILTVFPKLELMAPQGFTGTQ